jgi:hypothetical protein
VTPADAVPNQVSHAMAGIIIGFQYNLPYVQSWLLSQEPEPADVGLYKATFPLGESLDDGNVTSLAARVQQRLAKRILAASGLAAVMAFLVWTAGWGSLAEEGRQAQVHAFKFAREEADRRFAATATYVALARTETILGGIYSYTFVVSKEDGQHLGTLSFDVEVESGWATRQRTFEVERSSWSSRAELGRHTLMRRRKGIEWGAPSRRGRSPVTQSQRTRTSLARLPRSGPS